MGGEIVDWSGKTDDGKQFCKCSCDALKEAADTMGLAYECISNGRTDEALLHLGQGEVKALAELAKAEVKK